MRSAKITHNAPSCGLIAYWMGRLWLWLFNWEVKGDIPRTEKFILIGAPHTTSWDFPFTLAAASVFRLKISWIGKHTLFKKPFGGFMRWLGGIPINLKNHSGMSGT